MITAGDTAAVVTGSGTATVTITGTIAQIHAMLSGASNSLIVYTLPSARRLNFRC